MNQPSEYLIPVGKVDPQAANNTTKDSDIADASKFRAFMAILAIGVVDSTVDFKLQESDKSDFSANVTDVSGKAITQFSATDDNKVAVINLKTERMTKRYLRARATLGNGTAQNLCVILLGVDPAYGPASDDKLATVAQIVT